MRYYIIVFLILNTVAAVVDVYTHKPDEFEVLTTEISERYAVDVDTVGVDTIWFSHIATPTMFATKADNSAWVVGCSLFGTARTTEFKPLLKRIKSGSLEKWLYE